MIRKRTFSDTHYRNFFGKQALYTLEKLQQQALKFIDNELGGGQVISISETRDQNATTVTVWYKTQNIN